MKLFVGAKAIVVFKGKVLLVRESKDYLEGSEVGKWDMVGGRIEPEEEVRVGLLREVKEEAGLDVVPIKLIDTFDGWPTIQGERCHVVRLYFLCEAQNDDVQLSPDHDKYEWVDPKNYGEKVLMNDIKEMLDVASELI